MKNFYALFLFILYVSVAQDNYCEISHGFWSAVFGIQHVFPSWSAHLFLDFLKLTLKRKIKSQLLMILGGSEFQASQAKKVIKIAISTNKPGVVVYTCYHNYLRGLNLSPGQPWAKAGDLIQKIARAKVGRSWDSSGKSPELKLLYCRQVSE
jgi:hypothetical protein